MHRYESIATVRRIMSDEKNNELDVDYIAHLARIQLTKEELEQFKGQLQQILDHVDELSELDVEGVEPTAHAVPVHNVFREDKVREHFEDGEGMTNAPAQKAGQFLVPRIIE